MKTLNNLFLELKAISEKIIKELKNDNLDEIDALLDKRQDIIDEISNVDYTKEEFTKIYNDIFMQKIEEELNAIFKEKHDKLRMSINKLKLNKVANSNYANKTPVDSIFLNKKY